MQFREQTTEPPNSLQQTTHHSDSGEQFEAAHFALLYGATGCTSAVRRATNGAENDCMVGSGYRGQRLTGGMAAGTSNRRSFFEKRA